MAGGHRSSGGTLGNGLDEKNLHIQSYAQWPNLCDYSPSNRYVAAGRWGDDDDDNRVLVCL